MARRKPREKQVSVRLAGADLALLERAAAAVRLNVEAYIRQHALAAASRDDTLERGRRVAAALTALREGISRVEASRMRAAHRRSE